MPTLDGKLIVAVSSRALFDLEEANAVYENASKSRISEYADYQLDHENDILDPGTAYQLVRRLSCIRVPGSSERAVEVILISRNDANTGLRIFNSIKAHGLPITRAAFTCGNDAHQYLRAFGAHLFLSANPEDVRMALESGFPSAQVWPGAFGDSPEGERPDEVRIAFDGDAVIFSDESERIFQAEGLEEFQRHESAHADEPMGKGPFYPFLSALHRIRQAYPDPSECPIRLALVTARNAPSHERPIKTLRKWGIHLDEAFFLGGLDKTPILKAFQPHIFFDDQLKFIEPAAGMIPVAQVLSGIKNNGSMGASEETEVDVGLPALA